MPVNQSVQQKIQRRTQAVRRLRSLDRLNGNSQGASGALAGAFVFFDFAVAEADGAVGVEGDIGLVSD